MTARCRLVALIAPLVLVVVACSGGGLASPTSPRAPSTTQVEFASYGYVNEARSAHQVDPQLELREVLARIAREHSEAMRNEDFFGHDDGLGRRVGQRLSAAGITFRVAAENLAMVTNSPDPAGWAHERLMESADHRPNILDPGLDLIGVGVATDGSTYWLTQVFVGL